MKTKLGKTLKTQAVEWKLGDFLRNFIAVVLGIVITFIGSDLIEEHNTKNEVKRTLLLVKNELEVNKQDLEIARNWHILQTTAAHFFMQHKDHLSQVPADTLERYATIPSQWCSVHFTNDALELLKTSSLFQKINDEQLSLSLIKVYSDIDQSSDSFHAFNEFKMNLMNAVTEHMRAQKIDIEAMPALTQWEQILSTIEGRTLIKQIPRFFGNEYPFDNTLQEIDEVVKAIEQYNK